MYPPQVFEQSLFLFSFQAASPLPSSPCSPCTPRRSASPPPPPCPSATAPGPSSGCRASPWTSTPGRGGGSTPGRTARPSAWRRRSSPAGKAHGGKKLFLFCGELRFILFFLSLNRKRRLLVSIGWVGELKWELQNIISKVQSSNSSGFNFFVRKRVTHFPSLRLVNFCQGLDDIWSAHFHVAVRRRADSDTMEEKNLSSAKKGISPSYPRFPRQTRKGLLLPGAGNPMRREIHGEKKVSFIKKIWGM